MNDAANAREALRLKDYKGAVEYARKLLTENPGSHPMNYMLSKPTFARLGAALDDEHLLELFDSYLAGSETMAGFWEDLATCRWVTEQLEEESPFNFKEMCARASEDEHPRIKTMLTWMEKVGRVHIVGDQVVLGSAPAQESEPKPAPTVPIFNEYYATSKDMGPEQREFYVRFRQELRSGSALELEGNLSYGFVLLNELLKGAVADPEEVSRNLDFVATSYPKTSLERYAKRWQADLWFLAGDFQRGYNTLVEHGALSLDIYLTLTEHVDSARLTLPIVKSWLGADLGITEFGKSKQLEIETVALELIDSAHDVLGQSVVVDLWRRFLLASEGNFDAIDIEKDFGGLRLRDDLVRSLEFFEARKNRKGMTADRMRVLAFQGATEATQPPIPWPVPLVDNGSFSFLAEARLRALFREAENVVRANEGIPNVGEGWVSEVNLLNQLREAFPDHAIVHQGRPAWLKPQSLDIYFPDAAVAIEYQGLQHTQPVERFGGAKAFENQIARDSRKRKLCRENGCTLIEVHPGYDLSSVIKEIKASLH